MEPSQNPKCTQGFANISSRKFEPTQQSLHPEGALDLRAYIDQINREQDQPKPRKKLAGAFVVKNEVEVVQQKLQDSNLFKGAVNKKYNVSPVASKNASDPAS